MTRDDLRSRAEELLGRVARAEAMGDHDRAGQYERELRGVWASLARMGSATGQSTADRPTGGTDDATGTAGAPAPIGPDPIRNEVDRLHNLADRAVLADDLDTAQSYARQAAALQGRAVDAPSDVTAGPVGMIQPDTSPSDPTCKPTVADKATAVRGG